MRRGLDARRVILAPAGAAAAAAQSMQRQARDRRLSAAAQVRQVARTSRRQDARRGLRDRMPRGGEWVSYDRAKLEPRRRIWQAAAESGTRSPDRGRRNLREGARHGARLCARQSWYRKAADRATRAQFNLGTLYEQGLGVEKDVLQALNLYRSAGGLEGDVGYEEAYRRGSSSSAQSSKAIEERDHQIDALEQQIEELERKLGKGRLGGADGPEPHRSTRCSPSPARTRGSQTRLTALPPSRTREPSAADRQRRTCRRRRHPPACRARSWTLLRARDR